MAGPPSGKGGDRAETTARPRTPEHRGRAKDTQTRRKSPRSRRLDLPRPHHLFELARSAHRQDSRETRLSSEDRKRKRLYRFNAEGIDGLGDRPGAGGKPRITEDERSRIIALVSKDPPGKLLTEPGGGLQPEDETKAAYWTLDALAEAANEIGIEVGRSQVRRILLAEGVRWRRTRPWAESADPEFVPKDRG